MLKLANKQISIKSKIDEKKNVALKADPNLIDQAFNNLAKNAINSINEKTSLVNDHKGEIIISLEIKKPFCKLIMVDNGIGLPMNKEFLMEPYISRSKNGSGIGLAVVKKIMQDHNGNIELENNKNNKGAKVSLMFPLN
jgi:two-component system nitrogen regulation sensor histidine kinase NtrY